VTFALTVNGPEMLWSLTDRRLSYDNDAPRDDGRKVMFLDTTDGQAILTYAGLGATARGTEPADWMKNVLRGRNLPMEGSLEALAVAAKKQLPAHLLQFPGTQHISHSIAATAFVEGEPRLYTTEITFTLDRKQCWFRHARRLTTRSKGGLGPPRVAGTGSGASCLFGQQEQVRQLLHLVNACDRKRLSPYDVADYLAGLNLYIHRQRGARSCRSGCLGPRGALQEPIDELSVSGRRRGASGGHATRWVVNRVAFEHRDEHRERSVSDD
jgi:hypothetical protein